MSTTLIVGNTVGSNDNPEIDFQGEAQGEYIFTYTTDGGTCTDDAELRVNYYINDTADAALDYGTAQCGTTSNILTYIPSCFTLSSLTLPTIWTNNIASGQSFVRDAYIKFTAQSSNTIKLVADTVPLTGYTPDLTKIGIALYDTVPSDSNLVYSQYSEGLPNYDNFAFPGVTLNNGNTYYLRIGQASHGSHGYYQLGIAHTPNC